MTGKSILRDVAQAAGVSLRTASRVLNDDPKVAEQTRARVQAVMRELHYTPDSMARSLRAGTDATVGLVVESVADPFFSELVEAVEISASEAGKSVLVASTRRDPGRERDLVGQMLQRRVSGLLVVPAGGDHSWLAGTSTPLVLVDRAAENLAADVVRIDDRRAAADAVQHLIDHGHRRIAYVGDLPGIPTSAQRLEGYREALTKAGIEPDDALIRADCADSREAAAATTRIVAEQNPTALFSATTRGSLGVVPALHAARRTDVALVGFGDFAMADALSPAVTVIDHSARAVGLAAAARLAERLADPGLPVITTHLPVRLIERGSGELRPLP
jgi:LacI family transcriptional regulator, galactose operon repressor